MLELITQCRDVLFIRLSKPFIGKPNWLVSHPPNLYPSLNLHLTSTHKCCPQKLNYRGGLSDRTEGGMQFKDEQRLFFWWFLTCKIVKNYFSFPSLFLSKYNFVLLYSSFLNSLQKINDWRSATQDYPYQMLSGYRCTRVLINRYHYTLCITII